MDCQKILFKTWIKKNKGSKNCTAEFQGRTKNFRFHV